MVVNKMLDGDKLTMSLEGRLDTTSAPLFETEFKASADGITELVVDFSGVEYISSAGLRVLLSAQKIMNKQGSMIVKNVNDSVMEVFELTGFSDFLTIE